MEFHICLDEISDFFGRNFEKNKTYYKYNPCTHCMASNYKPTKEQAKLANEHAILFMEGYYTVYYLHRFIFRHM